MSEQALTVRAEEIETLDRVTPADMIREATAQATALSGLIEKQKLYSMISGRKYVRVEGWVPLARMNNVIPREVENVMHEDGRYVARVQLVRLTDGMVLTEASGECGGPDEMTWQNRPPYARRSMAATRATGKACRLAYSWIIALAGYEPTPAEEMDGVADRPGPRSSSNADYNREPALAPSDKNFTLPWGKHKGKRLCDVETGYLSWLLDKVTASLESDEYKPGGAKHDRYQQEYALGAALEQEISDRKRADEVPL